MVLQGVIQEECSHISKGMRDKTTVKLVVMWFGT